MKLLPAVIVLIALLASARSVAPMPVVPDLAQLTQVIEAVRSALVDASLSDADLAALEAAIASLQLLVDTALGN